MTRRRSRLITLVAAAIVASTAVGVATPSVGAQSDDNDSTVSKPGVVEEFFVVQADRGSVVKGRGSKVSLRLEDVDRNAVVFTDRPSRLAGSVPVSSIVKKWAKVGLAEDPPNAAISVIEGRGRGTATTYTLSHPELEKHSLVFTATPLQDLSEHPELASAIQDHVTEATGKIPKRFGASTLFIDPTSEGLIQSCTAQIANLSGSAVAGVVGSVLPTDPAIYIAPNSGTQVKTSSLGACTIAIAFTTGARTWSVSMTAATGHDNTYGSSSNVSVQPGDIHSPKWTVIFTLN